MVFFDEISAAEIRKARVLIKSGKLNAAIRVLDNVKDHPEAAQMLARLKRLQQAAQDEKPTARQPSSLPAVWTIAAIMLFWSCGLTGWAVTSPQAASLLPLVLLGLVVGWLVMAGYHWLLWRHFWWGMAATWFMVSLIGLFVLVFASDQRLVIAFIR